MDDFDAPNSAPGKCPECGQRADIWDFRHQWWECSLCDWKGRNPERTQGIDKTRNS